jgi:hypothetical protein
LLKVFFSIAISLLATLPVIADENTSGWRPDTSVAVIGRTYSAGLLVTPAVGYSYLLWGDPASGLFGFVRPNVSAPLSSSSYSGRAELEIFPVTFFGFSGGRTWLHRFATATGQDCTLGQCLGDMSSSDLNVRALFKVGSVFGSAKYSRVFVDQASDRTQSLLDPATSLLMSPDGEIATQLQAVVGATIMPFWSAGGIYQSTTLQNSSATQNAEYFFARYEVGSCRFMGAAGRFESQLKNPGLSLLGSVTWVGLPGYLP